MEVSYNQVRHDDLKNLSFQTGAASKDSLQHLDKEVTHWSADEGAVCSHLRHTGADVMAMFTAVMR